MKTTMKILNAAILAALLVLIPRLASAQKAAIKSVQIENKTPNFQDPDPDKWYPKVTIKVGTSATGLRATDFQVKAADSDPPVSLPGQKVIPFKDSDEELDIAILVQGSVRFMGDPNPEPQPGEEQAEIKGYFNEVKQAVDVIAHARASATVRTRTTA